MHTEPTRQLRDMIEDAMDMGLGSRAANEMHNALSNLELSLALPLTQPTKADPRILRIHHAYRQDDVAACGHIRGTDAICDFGEDEANVQDAACADCFAILADQPQARAA